MTEKSSPTPATNALSRRRLFAGAGAVGAVAAAATVLPLAKIAAPAVAQSLPAAKDAGYQLTEHVLRYYQTARV